MGKRAWFVKRKKIREFMFILNFFAEIVRKRCYKLIHLIQGTNFTYNSSRRLQFRKSFHEVKSLFKRAFFYWEKDEGGGWYFRFHIVQR